MLCFDYVTDSKSDNERVLLGQRIYSRGILETMDLKVGYVCDRGLSPRRPVNQDRYLAIPERGLFAVFDGVGGQRAGEVASQTAAETIEEALTHHTARITDGESVELIRRAIDFANRDVFELAESDPAYKTMATTVALIHIAGNTATIAHVGDSRVYRLEGGHFHRETVDHTDLNDEIRAGKITPEIADRLASRNIINRALGVESVVDVEIKTIRIRDGARFLLCSDGIYRHLSDEEIARVLSEHKEPQRAADELKRIVHQRGADDNLTAVVVQVGRNKQAPIISIDDGMPKSREKGAVQRASQATRAQAAGGRIKVEFNPLAEENTRRLERKIPLEEFESNTSVQGRSRTRVALYAMIVLVLVAGAFYGGLRASDFVRKGAAVSNSNRGPDSLQTGKEAFERGDYKLAATEFESAARREPTNARASYWLGRAQLEQREYELALKSFDEAINRQPSMSDAYLQQAVAYEALGEKSKAAAALGRYVEERRKQPVSAAQ
jgi:serine/threonine protein phosphatase PrpC